MDDLVSVPVHAIEMVLLSILDRCLQPRSQVASKTTYELQDLLHIRITKRSQAGFTEPHDTVVGSISDEAQHYFAHRYFQIGTYQHTGMPSQCSLHLILDGCRMVEGGADLALNPLAIAMKTHRTFRNASVACSIRLVMDTASVVLRSVASRNACWRESSIAAFRVDPNRRSLLALFVWQARSISHPWTATLRPLSGRNESRGR